MADSEDKAERDESPHQVARDHDALTIEAIEQNARERPRQHGGNCAREHQSGNYGSAMGFFDRQAENGDVVEVIADLADDLAHPGEAIIAIACEELRETGHQPGCLASRESVIACPRCRWVCSARCTSRPMTVVGRARRPTDRAS